jgi:WKF domain
MAVRQPKWRSFLALNGQQKLSTHASKLVNGEDNTAVIPELNVGRDLHATPEPKKRKRTDEEIAQRKAKKIRNKGKEAQEWKQLSEDHQKKSVSEQADNAVTEPTASLSSSNSNAEDKSEAKKPDAALLSTKAKEIAKAQREEKLHEKHKPSEKAQTDTGRSAQSEDKANQVLQYLDEYQAHIDTGSGWKFKKQHQNWIVKHLYSYPWKSDDLVIGYLKTVKGNARQRLIDEAKKIGQVTGDDEIAHSEDVVRRAKGVMSALTE